MNGSDPKWKESLNKHRRIQKQVSNLANDEIRFVDIEELRYSLRTVEKYAPFVRFIFIVTCGQIPNWINQEHPKVRFIQHSQIFKDRSNLPTFNSNAIEANINNITGLAEHYVYFNDDVFLGAPVTPSDFFVYPPQESYASLTNSPLSDPKEFQNYIGMPIWLCHRDFKGIKIMQREYQKAIQFSKVHKYAPFESMHYYTLLTFYNKYQKEPPLNREHIAMPLTKTLVNEVMTNFNQYFQETKKHRFRAVNDIVFLNLIFYYGVEFHKAVPYQNNTPGINVFFYLSQRANMVSIKKAFFNNDVENFKHTKIFQSNQNNIGGNNAPINSSKIFFHLKKLPKIFCINCDSKAFRSKVKALLEIITREEISSFEKIPSSPTLPEDLQFWL